MSVNLNPQITSQNSYCKIKEKGSTQPYFGVNNSNTSSTPDKILKPVVLLSAMGGVFMAVLNIAKCQKVKIFETKKFTDIFKNTSKLKYEWKEIVKLASGSILGGLTAGLLLDGENKKAKCMEGLQQMVGNILIPIGCVTIASKLLNKYEDKINIPKINSENSIAKYINKNSRGAIKTLGTLAALALGIEVGNLTANKLNQIIFNKKERRKIELGDFSGHLDDVCLASTLIAPDNKFFQKVGQLIPIALLVSGYETGTDKTKV